MNIDLLKQTQLLVIHGSRAYGMNTATSDVDVKGFLIAPREVYLGCLENLEQVEGQEEIACFLPYLTEEEQEVSAREKLEGTVYEVRKFITLCRNMNPSMIDVLFTRDEEVRICTPLGEKLRENRDIFLSTKAFHTYTGYAFAQLKRIRTHRSWLLSPPGKKPDRADYDLPAVGIASKDQMGAVYTVVDRLVEDGMTLEQAYAHVEMKSAMRFLEAERKYQATKKEWDQYTSWKKHRNVQRAALEAESGFDRKHGSHLVRLLRMGKEILETGQVHIFRPDAEELLSIRNGAWTYEQVEEYAEAMQEEMQVFYKTGKSPLPHTPDEKRIEELCVDIVSEGLRL